MNEGGRRDGGGRTILRIDCGKKMGRSILLLSLLHVILQSNMNIILMLSSMMKCDRHGVRALHFHSARYSHDISISCSLCGVVELRDCGNEGGEEM